MSESKVNEDFEPGDMIQLDWVDSAAINGWMTEGGWRNSDKRARNMRSVGYFLHNDADEWIVCQSLNDALGDAQQMSEVLCIPRCAVKSVRRVVAPPDGVPS